MDRVSERKANQKRRAFGEFRTAARHGKVVLLRARLATHPELGKAVDDNGLTALMLAAEGGHAACAELLIPFSDPLAVNEHGRRAGIAAIGHGDFNGRAPFMLGSSYSLCASSSVLLPERNFLARNFEYGWSALMYAARGGHVACVESLLPASDLSARDSKGRTALDLARERDHDLVVLAFERYQRMQDATLEGAEILKHMGSATNDQESGAAAPRKSPRL